MTLSLNKIDFKNRSNTMDFIRKSRDIVVGSEQGNTFILVREGKNFNLSFTKKSNDKDWEAEILSQFVGDEGMRLAQAIFETTTMEA